MNPIKNLGLILKATWVGIQYKVASKLLKMRNKPPAILIYPDKRLKRVAEPVDFEKTSYEERVAIVRKMGAALGGTEYGMKLGLAATQIGINKRVIIVRGNVMFNPEWEPVKEQTETTVEGCYSVPHKKFTVTRPKYGWAKWTDINGNPCEDKISGLAATVFQHELDHINGICCIERGEEIE